MLDVVICGAGVAGCALAIHLRRQGLGVRVVGRKPTARPVGEHLPPHARPLLAELGIWADFLSDGHLRCPGIRSAWGSDQIEARDFIFTPYGDGWNLDRARFDRRMVQTARQAGAEVQVPAALTALERTPHGWTVEIVHDGRRTAHACRLVVDATGRASVLARRLGSRRIAHDRLIAVAGWLANAANQRDQTLLLEAVPQGWWYTTPLPDNTQIAVWMTDPPLRLDRPRAVQALWREHLARTEHVRQRLAGCTPLGDPLVRPANTYRMEPPVGENWLAVGDAAAALDPLSSMGIFRAFTWAAVAAAAIICHLNGDKTALPAYAAALRHDFTAQQAARAWAYRQEQRWADQPFWRTRHAASAAGGVEEHPADGDRRGVAVVGGAGGIARGLPGHGAA